tara:strand:- start:4911 stop:5219 length:309 start_codon:yes stop_codon:yes gene_type:complete
MCGYLGGKNMYREFIIFTGIVVISLFMTIHNHNKKTMLDSENKLSLQKASLENSLMEDGTLIRLNSGVTLTKRADLIIIKDSYTTIILNKEDAQDVIAFLER